MSKSIYELTNELDDKLVQEANSYSYTPFFKKKLFKIGGLCASIAIVIVSAILLLPLIFAPDVENLDNGIEFVEQDKQGNSTPWKDRSIYEKYPTLSFNDISYSTAKVSVDKSKLDALLGEGYAVGYDEINDKEYNEEVEFYSIVGIESSKAIAVKFNGESGYYLYRSSEYVSGAIDKIDFDFIITPPQSNT